jgi:hypothetical protein
MLVVWSGGPLIWRNLVGSIQKPGFASCEQLSSELTPWYITRTALSYSFTTLSAPGFCFVMLLSG